MTRTGVAHDPARVTASSRPVPIVRPALPRATVVARLGWAVVVVAYLAIFLASLPHGYAALAPADSVGLAELGIEPRSYALAMTLMRVALVAVFAVLAGLVAWRRPDDPLALGTSAALVGFGVTQTGALWDLAAAAPEVWWVTPVGAALYIPLLTFLLSLLPDGRFVAPMTFRVVLLIAVATTAARTWFSDPASAGVMAVVAIVWQGLLLGHLAWRHRHSLDPVGREQVRWVLLGMAIAFVAGQLFGAPRGFVPVLTGDTAARYLWELVGVPLAYLAYVSVPLTLAFSMLHHRLYGIDLVVHRALVYVPVAALLAGLLAVTLFVAQSLFVSITGERSDLVTAVATLVVVAAFEPVRAGVTALVDRAFLRVRDPAADVRSLARDITDVLDVLDRRRLAARLLATATAAYEPTGGAILVNDDGPLHRLASSEGWDGSAEVILPLMSDGRRIGTFALGPRVRATGYSERDLDALADLAAVAARALDRRSA